MHPSISNSVLIKRINNLATTYTHCVSFRHQLNDLDRTSLINVCKAYEEMVRLDKLSEDIRSTRTETAWLLITSDLPSASNDDRLAYVAWKRTSDSARKIWYAPVDRLAKGLDEPLEVRVTGVLDEPNPYLKGELYFPSKQL